MCARQLFSLIISLLMGGIWVLSLNSHTYGDSVALESKIICGARVHCIKIDLNDPAIKLEICLPAKGIPHSESFSSMIKRTSPVAAVTGTYFDTRSLYPVGSIVTGGKVIYESAIGTQVCFIKKYSTAEFASSAGELPRAFYNVKFINKSKGERSVWSGVECGLRTGPRLLVNGNYYLNPRKEGFRHPGLFGSRTRIALGVTVRNKLLLVSVKTPVTFGRLVSIMKALGATDAVCLDGGTSSAMYYYGRHLSVPGRKLTNIIAIHRIKTAPADNVARVYDYAQINVAANFLVNKWPISIFENKPANCSCTIRRYGINGKIPCYAQQPETQYALLVPPVILGLPKSLHALVPIDRTQFTRLKGLKDPKNFVNVSSNIKVVHNLVA